MGHWTVHESGYCSHISGMQAAISRETDCDFVSVVGPYSLASQGHAAVSAAAWELTEIAEAEYPKRFAVWGAESFDRDKGLEIRVLGEQIKWTPDPSARTNWGISHMPTNQLEKEWTVLDRWSIQHRSGATIRFEAFSALNVWSLRKVAAEIIIDGSARLWRHSEVNCAAHALAKISIEAFCMLTGFTIPPKISRLQITEERLSHVAPLRA